MTTFIWYSETRNSWRKSFETAVRYVLTGKMTREEYVALAVPSPAGNDPEPVAYLELAIAGEEGAKVAWAEKTQREAWERAERAAKIEAHRHNRVWALGGLFMEETTQNLYTLAELESWAGWSGYPLRGRNAEVGAVLLAPGERGNLVVDLSGKFYDSEKGRRQFNFGKAVQNLREYVAECRS